MLCRDNFNISPKDNVSSVVYLQAISPAKHLLNLSQGFCLFDCQANLKTAKEARRRTARYMLRGTKELIWCVKSQNTVPRRKNSGWCDSHKTTTACMKTSRSWMTCWLWVEPVYENAIHDTATVDQHTGTNTNSTHSDVQTHIPLVGSWSKVRKCEICQPIGDWVIEEFDSERNILLPWWWTRRNDIVFSRRKVQQEIQKFIINTEESRNKQRT